MRVCLARDVIGQHPRHLAQLRVQFAVVVQLAQELIRSHIANLKRCVSSFSTSSISEASSRKTSTQLMLVTTMTTRVGSVVGAPGSGASAAGTGFPGGV